MNQCRVYLLLAVFLAGLGCGGNQGKGKNKDKDKPPTAMLGTSLQAARFDLPFHTQPLRRNQVFTTWVRKT